MGGKVVKKAKDNFSITYGRGFQICRNNVVLSVQFGYGNYCDNRNDEKTWPQTDKLNTEVSSDNAEVAIFRGDDGIWLTKKVWLCCFNEKLSDDVVGYVTPEKLVKLMAWLSRNSMYWAGGDEDENLC